MNMPAAQRGVAMLVALLIVAIATTVAASIFVSQRYDIRLSTNIQDLEQAYQYAYGMEEWSGIWLQRDAQDNNFDSLTDMWAQEIPPLPIEENGVVLGTIEGKLEDMHGLFNLNSLLNEEGTIDADAYNGFRTLLQEKELPLTLADAVFDWIDKDSVIREADSAESDYYLSGERPYYAANSLLVDVSELKLLKLGYVDNPQEKLKALEAILPLVVALPGVTKINVNTASESVLRAAGLNQQQMDKLGDVSEAPIESFDELKNLMAIKTVNKETGKEELVIPPHIGVQSQYFRLSGKITYGKSQLYVNSLLYRGEKQGQVHVIMRQFEPIATPQDEPKNTENNETITEENDADSETTNT